MVAALPSCLELHRPLLPALLLLLLLRGLRARLGAGKPVGDVSGAGAAVLSGRVHG